MKVVLVGGGGHCRSCIDVIRDAGLEIAGIVDPQPVSELFSLPRLGNDDWLESPEARKFRFLVTLGQVGLAPLRRKIFASLQNLRLECVTVFGANAVISGSAKVGVGSIILNRAAVNAGAKVGMNCIINTGAIVEHGASIGDHSHISTGAIVNGDAVVGSGCLIGSGAIVLQGVKVAPDTIVGAGAVVTADIVASGTWVGIPARMIS